MSWIKGKGKFICLESRYRRGCTCSSDGTFSLAVGAYGSLQLSIQPWMCDLVSITAGWREAVWNTKFAWHFYKWPADVKMTLVSIYNVWKMLL